MDIIGTLVSMGVDAKTVALIWFAIVYEKRLVALESLIKNMRVCQTK